MTRLQKRLFAILVTAGLAAHVVSLVTGNQYWPFVSYTVLATRFDDDFDCFVPYGIPEDSKQPDFRVWDAGYFTLRFTLLKIMEYPWRNAAYDQYAAGCPTETAAATHACASQKLAVDVLQFLYAQYEDGRKDQPEQPRLRGMRLYHVFYGPRPEGGIDVRSKELAAEWLRTEGAR